jgi:putative acetyltransferase
MADEQITADDPREPDVRALLERHREFALAQTPPEHSFALDLDKLPDPAITFFGFRAHGILPGIGAIKCLSPDHAEIKSMHTAGAARGRWIGRAMLTHLLEAARTRGLRRVSLETGTTAAFAPARALYHSAGFISCGPFASYQPSDDNLFMTLERSSAVRVPVRVGQVLVMIATQIGPGPSARPPVRLGAAASRAVPHPETRRRARHQSWQEFIALSPASVAVILVQAMPRQSSDPGRIVCRTRSLSVMAFRQATCSADWVRGPPRDQVDHTSWALSRGVASGDRPAHGRTAGFPGSGPACRAYRRHARLDSATSSLMLTTCPA